MEKKAANESTSVCANQAKPNTQWIWLSRRREQTSNTKMKEP